MVFDLSKSSYFSIRCRYSFQSSRWYAFLWGYSIGLSSNASFDDEK